MKWEEAENLLSINLTKGLQLNESRIIIEIPPYHCYNKSYLYDEPGYLIQIVDKKNIQIPCSMLRNIFYDALSENDGIYNRSVFVMHYSNTAYFQYGHVEIIAQMFEAAGVVEYIGGRKYQIL